MLSILRTNSNGSYLVWTVFSFYKYWAALRPQDEVFILTEINLSIRVLAFAMYLVIAMRFESEACDSIALTILPLPPVA
ncbi:hypothetical protein CPB85DRAFT_1302806 [Mucidula mucida]|nr:hypothetical protein CPB85DRAFT_1302806 [Mucidula mucida]